MKRILNVLTLLLISSFVLISCGDNDNKKKPEKVKIKTYQKKEPKKSVKKIKVIVDLNNKGIGPITSIKLEPTIDATLAAKGAELYKVKCSACHKPTTKFIGPAPTGVLERRTPEWIMNMILNPEEMIKKDPIAKQLLIDYNGSPMENQNLTEEEARSILEYFRTLK